MKLNETEKRVLRSLSALPIPGGPPPGWNDPTPEELAEKAAHETRRRRLTYVLAEYRRRYPAMVAAEDAREARETAEIRRRVFERSGLPIDTEGDQ